MKTSIFTNGHTDSYKGKREVKAGWAIIDNSTERTIASGHSLTQELAYSNASSIKHCPNADIKWCSTVGVKNGDFTVEEIKKMNEENREFRNSTRIETVPL